MMMVPSGVVLPETGQVNPGVFGQNCVVSDVPFRYPYSNSGVGVSCVSICTYMVRVVLVVSFTSNTTLHAPLGAGVGLRLFTFIRNVIDLSAQFTNGSPTATRSMSSCALAFGAPT